MQRRNFLKSSVVNPLESALHLWDSDNLVIAGDFITATDVGILGGLDLVNPALANKPTYSSSDSNFNNKPSLTFNGTSDYLLRAISGFRSLDQSGVFISVFKLNLAATAAILSIGINGSTSNNFVVRVRNNKYESFTTSPVTASVSSISSPQLTPTVLASISTSSELQFFIDGVKEVGTPPFGVNNGQWFGDMSGINYISIAARLSTSVVFQNMTWVMTGYFPYVNDSNIVEISNFLQSKYNV